MSNIQPEIMRYLGRRSGFWYYVRRVPEEYVPLDRRGIIKISTKVRIADDPRGVRAQRVADRINGETEAYWRGIVAGQAAEARRRYDEARRRARSLGYDYVLADDLAQRPVTDILDRLERLIDRGAVDTPRDVAAVLGGESPPAIMISGLVEEYEALSRAGLKVMSEDQVRKWRNPKKRAVANLLAVVGDKPLSGLSRRDALDFRMWWQDRVIHEDLDIGTANKDIGHINKMLRTLDMAHHLGMAPVFGQLRLEGEKTSSRAAFAADFVQRRLLDPGVLDGLNEEARAVVFLMCETGMRLSEMANLTAATIHLDAPVPYVSVRPDGRKMKTDQSERDIPLVGVALRAMQAFSEGFPRYRHKADSLSALVNKYLENAGLRPTEEHTLYSLRHTFEDRLTAVEAPEKLIAALMGHKYSRPKYGSGPSLEQKREWLQRIAFKDTSNV